MLSFFRYILIDTNYFFCLLLIKKVSYLSFVFYSTYQRNRWRKCPHAIMCRVHLEGISFFFSSVVLVSRFSLSLSLPFLYSLAFSVSDNDAGLNIGWRVVLAAVLVHETWWQVEAMDNSNWWIEFIHLKKYTNKHTQMFKTGIICLRENKPLRKKDQSLPIKTERRISKEKIFLFIYILMRLTRRDLGNVVLIIYIRLSYSFTSVWLLKKKICSFKESTIKQLRDLL